MTENMKIAEIIHEIDKIIQNIHRGMIFQKNPITPTKRLPIDVAANQPPCIKPLYFGGATLETNEIPIGLKNNSAPVRTKYIVISHTGLTGILETPPFNVLGSSRPTDAATIIKNATAVMIMPHAIFLGAEGSFPRRFSAANIDRTTGVNITMYRGLNCWKSCGSIMFVDGKPLYSM